MRRTSLLVLLVVLFAATGASAKVFLVDMEIYANESVKLERVDVVNGSVKTAPFTGRYNISLNSRDGSMLYTASFPVSFKRAYFQTDPSSDSSSYSNTSSVDALFRLPYSRQASTLVVSRDTELLRVDLPSHLCTDDNRCLTYCRTEERIDMDPQCEVIKQPSQGGGVPVGPILGVSLILLSGLIYVTRLRQSDKEEGRTAGERKQELFADG